MPRTKKTTEEIPATEVQENEVQAAEAVVAETTEKAEEKSSTKKTQRKKTTRKTTGRRKSAAKAEKKEPAAPNFVIKAKGFEISYGEVINKVKEIIAGEYKSLDISVDTDEKKVYAVINGTININFPLL